MSEPNNLPAIRPSVQAGGAVGALVPQSIDEAWRLSEAFAKANILPRGITTAPQVMLVICGGAEVGFGPFQSLQSFYLVNNRLTLWGDAIPALLWTHGFKLKEWFENIDPAYPDNMVAKCIVTRPDGQEIEGEFSVADAKEAKLWAKDGPWQTSKKRMLKMRARAFAARDGAPDVLRGIAIREEVQDYDIINEVKTEPQTLTVDFDGDPKASVAAKRAARKKAAEADQPTDKYVEGPETQSATSDLDKPLFEGGTVTKRDYQEAFGRPTETGSAQPAEPEPATSETATAASTDGLRETEVSGLNATGKQSLDGLPQHAAPGEQYLLDGHPKDSEGRTPTFKDGVRFSSVKTPIGLPTYKEHAPEIAPEVEEAEFEDKHENDDEPMHPALHAFVEILQAAKDFDAVKVAYAEFQKGEHWKSLDETARNEIRANIWWTMEDTGAPFVMPDPFGSASAFRLWVEAQDEQEKLERGLSTLEDNPGFKAQSDGVKETCRGAVQARIDALE